MLPNQNATRATLEVFRAYVCLLWLAKLLIDPLQQLSRLPTSAYTAIGFLNLLGDSAAQYLYSEHFLLSLRLIGGAALLGSIGFRSYPRARLWSTVTASAILILYQALVRSIGAINHTETTLLFPMYALSGFDLIAVLRVRRPESPDPLANQHGWPIDLTMILVCCAYSFAGAHRLIVGGLGNFTSGIMTFWCVSKGLDPSYFEPVFGSLVMSSDVLRWAIEIGFPIVTVMEAAGLACCIWPRFRLPFVLTMVMFHIGVLLMMGILFWEPMALFVTFFDMQWMAKVRTARAWPGRSVAAESE